MLDPPTSDLKGAIFGGTQQPAHAHLQHDALAVMDDGALGGRWEPPFPVQ